MIHQSRPRLADAASWGQNRVLQIRCRSTARVRLFAEKRRPRRKPPVSVSRRGGRPFRLLEYTCVAPSVFDRKAKLQLSGAQVMPCSSASFPAETRTRFLESTRPATQMAVPVGNVPGSAVPAVIRGGAILARLLDPHRSQVLRAQSGWAVQIAADREGFFYPEP